MSYQVQMYSGKEGFDALEPKWRLLQERLPDARFLHYSAWYKAHLSCVEPLPDTVSFLYVSSDNEPVAVLPLRQVEFTRFGLTFAAYELYWPNDMGVCDGIFAKSAENRQLLAMLVRWLRQQKACRWDVLRLPDTLDDSNILHSFRNMQGMCALSILHHYSKHIPCGASYETVAGRLGGHFRRNVRRQAKKINALPGVEFRFVTSADEMEQAFEWFLEAEGSSWKGADGSGTAVRLSRQSTEFYRALMREFAQEGRCIIGLILVEGRCIAAQFAIRGADTIDLLKIGYDEEYRALGPGNVLMDELIRRYCEDVKAISFITGSTWNDCWSPTSVNVYNNTLFNRTWRGMVLCISSRIKDVGRKLRRYVINAKARFASSQPG